MTTSIRDSEGLLLGEMSTIGGKNLRHRNGQPIGSRGHVLVHYLNRRIKWRSNGRIDVGVLHRAYCDDCERAISDRDWQFTLKAFATFTNKMDWTDGRPFRGVRRRSCNAYIANVAFVDDPDWARGLDDRDMAEKAQLAELKRLTQQAPLSHLAAVIRELGSEDRDALVFLLSKGKLDSPD